MGANRQYKDSLFTLLFDQPDKMLELYNAITGKNLPASTPVQIATLPDALFMGRKNDLAFLIEDLLIVLSEQQSTLNENMPLRALMYIARIYENLLDNKMIYRQKLVKIPKPEFYVLYNGKESSADRKTLRLSEAFQDPPFASASGGSLELEIPIININKGYNEDVVQRSRHLNGYVAFVTKVRELENTGLGLEDSLAKAVHYCLANGILAEFFSGISGEVLNMLTAEFNLEEAKAIWQEEAFEAGEARGIAL
ncbi:MAG: Rpn family recombination-promoting nuclease/putative transposase, partial [Peptococcaceae bacterium]|nr:Rpn family recombination-promoting nuclease/putative transposase [Peptococcaceae bacterium]